MTHTQPMGNPSFARRVTAIIRFVRASILSVQGEQKMKFLRSLFSKQKQEERVAPTQSTSELETAHEANRDELIASLQKENPHPCLHDMRDRYWGHNISYCGGTYAAWTTPRIQNGDIIITEAGMFLAHHVQPCEQPKDMVFLSFVQIQDDPLVRSAATGQHGLDA